MDGLVGDLRHGVRMLVRTPLLSIVAVLTVGLGVGAVTFASSIVYAVLFRGPDVRDVDRLTVIRESRRTDGDELFLPVHDFLDLERAQTSFERVGGYYSGTVNVAGLDGPPERYQGAFVTAGVLPLLGVTPVLGRVFGDADDDPGAPATLLLGETAWRTRFAADPGVIGRTLRVNGEPAEIVGVLPASFRFPFNQDVWVPYRADPNVLGRREGQAMEAIGHLREGVSLETARAELDAIARRIEADYPEENEDITITAQPFMEANTPSEIVMMMGLLMAMVVGVLLVACANVANVLLARGVVREREIAVRSALGAERWRLVRQLLVEAVVLGLAGGLLGIVLSAVSLNVFEASIRDLEKPYWIVFLLDGPVLAAAIAVTLAAAVGAGMWPAVRASGTDTGAILRDETRGSSGLRTGRFTGALVVGELAVSCGLMIAAGLMIQALFSLNRIELGFEPDAVMTARLGLFESDYPDPDARSRFYHQLIERLAAEPGVEAATVASGLPGTGQGRAPLEVEGETYATPADRPRTGLSSGGPGYFETFAIPILEGRDFAVSETERGGEPVAVVSRAFVERHLGGGSALGRRIRVGDADDAPWLRIVGVAGDVHPGTNEFGGGGEVLRDAVWVPLAQQDLRFASIAVRTREGAGAAGNTLRGTVTAIDPNLPIYWVETHRQTVDEGAAMHRIFGSLFVIFGTAALFLAGVGLYGVMDFSVASRTREMGVRTALGASKGAVLRLVLGRVGAQLAIGGGLGVGLGLLLAVPLSATLFGVQRWSTPVYAGIVGLMALIGFAATLAPALRAVRVDPVVALRT